MCSKYKISRDDLDEDYMGADIACPTCRKMHEYGEILAWPTFQHKTGSKRSGNWGGSQLEDEEEM
jgi:hypothetical protein